MKRILHISLVSDGPKTFGLRGKAIFNAGSNDSNRLLKCRNGIPIIEQKSLSAKKLMQWMSLCWYPLCKSLTNLPEWVSQKFAYSSFMNIKFLKSSAFSGLDSIYRSNSSGTVVRVRIYSLSCANFSDTACCCNLHNKRTVK